MISHRVTTRRASYWKHGHSASRARSSPTGRATRIARSVTARSPDQGIPTWLHTEFTRYPFDPDESIICMQVWATSLGGGLIWTRVVGRPRDIEVWRFVWKARPKRYAANAARRSIPHGVLISLWRTERECAIPALWRKPRDLLSRKPTGRA